MTKTPPPSAEEVRAQWQRRADHTSTAELVHVLRLLAGLPQPHAAHDELISDIITSTLLARHPEAHQQWQAAPLTSKNSAEVIAAAVRGLGPRFAWLDNSALVTGTLGEYGLLWHYREYREPGEVSPVIKTWDGQTLEVVIDNPDEDLHQFTAGPYTYEETLTHYFPLERPQDTPEPTVVHTRPVYMYLRNGTLYSGTLVDYAVWWDRLHGTTGQTISEVVKTWNGEVLDVKIGVDPQADGRTFRAGNDIYSAS
ncbi:hypothetical protein ACIHDR_48210 [Nocardia sp. NPDC052278]|uniref:hypothetical protein n=1 Tax=unclassified Nocardia TaxID=2637762 RepID=UPI0036C13DC7